MATWMAHLRIADKLLDLIPGLSPIEFIVGNIAPDSGVPNEDWSVFTPDTKISHFKSGSKKAGPEAFAAKYFTSEQQNNYTQNQYSFYLGYLTHLITDVFWSEQIAQPSFREYLLGEPPYFGPVTVNKIKADWYDLDFKFLHDHPGFRAFRVYLGAVSFENRYMEEFAPDAFDNRREYITSFYLQENQDFDRPYSFLTEAEMDAFVEKAAKDILSCLKSYTSLPSQINLP